MSSRTAHSHKTSPAQQFTPADLAFAHAWEVHAPGLGGWTVMVDTDDDGTQRLYVDPPLVYGEGFVVRSEEGRTCVSWPTGSLQVGSVRDAMLTICPLSAEALEQVERLAGAPEPVL